MVKLVAIFSRPPDPDSFEDHYGQVHLPLIEKLPGLKRLETSKVTGAPMTTTQFYRMAEMYFDDNQAMNASLMSPEGIAAAKDLMSFAKNIVQMFFAEI